MTQYFARVDDDTGTFLFVARWGDDNSLERWDSASWVDFPELLRVTGVGGEESYHRIGEAEATAFIEGQKGGPGSGHWGHAGRPGQVGGSVGRDVAVSVATGRDWQQRQEQTKLDESFSRAANRKNILSDTRLGGGITDSRLFEYQGDGRGVWKEHDRDYSNSTAEVAADMLDDTLGLNVVPRTVLASNKDGAPGSSQRFIEDARTATEIQGRDWAGYEVYSAMMQDNKDRVEKIVLLDYIIGHPDRHGGNYVFDDEGQVWAIDHGLCVDWASRGGSGMAKYNLAGLGVNDDWDRVWQLSPLLHRNIQGLTRSEFAKVAGVTGNVYGLSDAWAKIQEIQETGELRW